MRTVVGLRGLAPLLAQGGERVVVYVADWCPYCADLVDGLARASPDDDRVVLADVSDEDDPAWDEAHLAVVPTALRYRDGKVVARLDGRLGRGLDAAQVRAFVSSAAG